MSEAVKNSFIERDPEGRPYCAYQGLINKQALSETEGEPQSKSDTEINYQCAKYQNGTCAIVGTNSLNNECGPSVDGMKIS